MNSKIKSLKIAIGAIVCIIIQTSLVLGQEKNEKEHLNNFHKHLKHNNKVATKTKSILDNHSKKVNQVLKNPSYSSKEKEEKLNKLKIDRDQKLKKTLGIAPKPVDQTKSLTSPKAIYPNAIRQKNSPSIGSSIPKTISINNAIKTSPTSSSVSSPTATNANNPKRKP